MKFENTKRYRMFKAKYLPATNFHGSRILIKDLRQNKKRFIHYSSDGGRMDEQAFNYLKSIGIKIKALAMADLDEDCLFLSEDFTTELK